MEVVAWRISRATRCRNIDPVEVTRIELMKFSFSCGRKLFSYSTVLKKLYASFEGHSFEGSKGKYVFLLLMQLRVDKV